MQPSSGWPAGNELRRRISENDLTKGRIVGMMVLYSSYGRNISKFGRSGEDVWYRATLRG